VRTGSIIVCSFGTTFGTLYIITHGEDTEYGYQKNNTNSFEDLTGVSNQPSSKYCPPKVPVWFFIRSSLDGHRFKKILGKNFKSEI